MNIRRADERDIAGINKLLYQVHRIHAEGRPDIFRLGNKKYFQRDAATTPQGRQM